MANRYLRANGNWNGAVWASTISGTAGSAATPTANDDVYIAANFSVSLTDDAICAQLIHTNGTLSISSNTLEITGRDDGEGDYTPAVFSSSGSTARTINCGSGKIYLHDIRFFSGWGATFRLEGTNLTFNAGNSLIQIDCAGDNPGLYTLSKTFADVLVNIGIDGNYSNTFAIDGSPTFRTLAIQSKNTAAHTITTTPSATITVARFVVIGSSAANRMLIQPSDYPGLTTQILGVDVSYGKWVNVRQLPVQPLVYGQNVYIGSTSVNSASIGWLTQDPPSISTLIDPMTTSYSSSSYWTTSGTVSNVTTGARGGGYSLGSGAALRSKDVYNVLDTEFIVEMKGGTGQTILPILESMLGVNGQKNYITVGLTVPPGQQAFFDAQFGDEWYPLDTGDPGFLKIKINSNGTLNIAYSQDGLSWDVSDSYGGVVIDPIELALLRSTRIKISAGSGTGIVGSFNTIPPFPLISAKSASDSGFPVTDPYISGQKKDYKTQISLDPGTYYWRVRAKDPSGSNQWGAWSEIRQFEVTEGGGAFLPFFIP